MGSRRQSWADVLAAAGAVGLVLSLWLHWYTLQLPPAAFDRLRALAGAMGAIGSLVLRETAVLRGAGPLPVTGWQVFHVLDVVLAVIAAAGGLLALLSLSERAEGTGGLTAAAGAVAVLVCGYRVLVPPSGPVDGLLHTASGAYVGLACAAVLLLSGLLGGAEASAGAETWPPAWAPEREPIPVARPGSSASVRSSVPPPAPVPPRSALD